MLCLEFIVVTASVNILQCYSVVCVEFIVVTAKFDVWQLCFVVCVVYCRYNNSRYSAIVLCCVWSLLWLQHYLI